MELRSNKEIKIKNFDLALLKKIDDYAKLKKISRSEAIRSTLYLQFNFSAGKMYEEQLDYERIAKYAIRQTKRNEDLMNKILEILNEK